VLLLLVQFVFVHSYITTLSTASHTMTYHWKKIGRTPVNMASVDRGLLKSVDVQTLVAGTPLAGKPLKRVYAASADGWDRNAFHAKVDYGRPTIIVAKPKRGEVVGGYNPFGWESRDDYRDTFNSFVFKVQRDGKIERCKKVGGSGAAIYDFGDYGPRFGGDALFVPLNPAKGSARLARSSLGTYYAFMSNGQGSLFGTQGQADVELEELEAYIQNIPGLVVTGDISVDPTGKGNVGSPFDFISEIFSLKKKQG